MNEANTTKKQFWIDHIEAASCSGLSIAQYARQHDIKPQRLYQWRNVIKASTATVPTKEKFTRVVTSTPVTFTRVTLRLSHATMEFDSLPDPKWLSALLSNSVTQQ